MAIQPQPGPNPAVPPPPPDPDSYVECVLPGGMHIITTVLNCAAEGGTPTGPPLPDDQAAMRRKELEGRQEPKG